MCTSESAAPCLQFHFKEFHCFILHTVHIYQITEKTSFCFFSSHKKFVFYFTTGHLQEAAAVAAQNDQNLDRRQRSTRQDQKMDPAKWVNETCMFALSQDTQHQTLRLSFLFISCLGDMESFMNLRRKWVREKHWHKTRSIVLCSKKTRLKKCSRILRLTRLQIYKTL